MRTFTLENKPAAGLTEMRKNQTIEVVFCPEPFVVATQEGPLTISPDTVDDWEDGYFVAYPGDGSKPYAIAPSFVRASYVAV